DARRRAQGVERPVGGAAVHDDHLVGLEGLPRHRSEEPPDVISGVLHGGDERDLHFVPRTCSYTCSVSRAVSSQEKRSDWWRPRSESLSARSSSVRTRSIAIAISRTERGFTPMADSPAVSGCEEVVDA